MGKRGNHGDIGAGCQRQMIRCLHVRGLDQIDSPRVDNDELCPLAEPLFQAARKNRMAIGWVGANNNDDIRVFD